MSLIVRCWSASDWIGFSPMTYTAVRSPRSIASNMPDRCQPRFGGTGHAPGRIEPCPERVVLDVLEAWQPVGQGAHVAAALDVVLATERVQATAVLADVSGEDRQVDERDDVVDRVVMLGDAEGPADHRLVGASRRRGPARG